VTKEVRLPHLTPEQIIDHLNSAAPAVAPRWSRNTAMEQCIRAAEILNGAVVTIQSKRRADSSVVARSYRIQRSGPDRMLEAIADRRRQIEAFYSNPIWGDSHSKFLAAERDSETTKLDALEAAVKAFRGRPAPRRRRNDALWRDYLPQIRLAYSTALGLTAPPVAGGGNSPTPFVRFACWVIRQVEGIEVEWGTMRKAIRDLG